MELAARDVQEETRAAAEAARGGRRGRSFSDGSESSGFDGGSSSFIDVDGLGAGGAGGEEEEDDEEALEDELDAVASRFGRHAHDNDDDDDVDVLGRILPSQRPAAFRPPAAKRARLAAAAAPQAAAHARPDTPASAARAAGLAQLADRRQALREALLDDAGPFARAAPFTLQRLAEVLADPAPQYTTVGKLCNAVDRVS